MLLVKEANAEPIPGYRLIEPLGRGGFGEVWKCEAPGGLVKAIKFVEGDHNGLGGDAAPAAEELKAIQHVKSLRHPFLLSMERVEFVDGELVIVMELADKSLQDLFNERRAAGATGINRDELLCYLREAADVLDLMNLRHGLQHLDVKPANLFLVSDHVKVADFGLVRNRAEGVASLGALTALYAAPELFRNSISQSCDQYSLAIVYQELLTGTLPFTGKSARQLALLHSTAVPDLQALPESDRPVVARALSKDPAGRFPTCSALLHALATSTQPTVQIDRAALADTINHAITPSATRAIPVVRPGRSEPSAPRSNSGQRRSSDGTQMREPAHARHLPGYEFQTCLNRTPFAEVWEAHAPAPCSSAPGLQASRPGEGSVRRCLVRFLYGVTGQDARREQEAVERLEALRHPALPALQLVHAGPGCLVAISDVIEDSLRERFQEYRGRGSAGIPRPKLLGWLRSAAEALDDLARRSGLQHLGLQPRSLQFDGDQMRIADFGLLPLLWQPAGQLPGQLQPRYAAPELFDGKVFPGADAYSLAVIYQEMLTGTPPWRGRRSGPPDLEGLSLADRDVIARALDDDPAQRFATCTELLDSLEGFVEGAEGEDAPTGMAARVAELIVEAGGSVALIRPEMWASTARGPVLQCRFPARPQGTLGRASFEVFRRRWNAQVVREGANSLVFQVSLPGRFWQRWLGGAPGLRVEVHWSRPGSAAAAWPEVAVRIRSDEKSGKADEGLLREVGPLVLDSLRMQVEAQPERRGRERLAWAHPVQALFRLGAHEWSEPIDGRGKDLSLTGMGLYLPQVPPGSDVQLLLTTSTHPEPIELLGHCVRVQRCPDGWYEAGIAFA
jgi:serine/threonine protein kinase